MQPEKNVELYALEKFGQAVHDKARETGLNNGTGSRWPPQGAASERGGYRRH
jgi:hypothetical protein